jgi:hypothetical protein
MFFSSVNGTGLTKRLSYTNAVQHQSHSNPYRQQHHFAVSTRPNSGCYAQFLNASVQPGSNHKIAIATPATINATADSNALFGVGIAAALAGNANVVVARLNDVAVKVSSCPFIMAVPVDVTVDPTKKVVKLTFCTPLYAAVNAVVLVVGKMVNWPLGSCVVSRYLVIDVVVTTVKPMKPVV